MDCTPSHTLLCWFGWGFPTSLKLSFTWWESGRYASCLTRYSSSKTGMRRLARLLHGCYYFDMSLFWHIGIISRHCVAASSNSWGWAKGREEKVSLNHLLNEKGYRICSSESLTERERVAGANVTSPNTGRPVLLGPARHSGLCAIQVMLPHFWLGFLGREHTIHEETDTP